MITLVSSHQQLAFLNLVLNIIYDGVENSGTDSITELLKMSKRLSDLNRVILEIIS